MTEPKKYQVYCTTTNKYEYVWSTSIPTKCPKNSDHTINTTLTTITKLKPDNAVVIQEENIQTGGNFAAHTSKINATKNTTSFMNMSWPYMISALDIEFYTGTEHDGDEISMVIGENTVIGVIVRDVLPAVTWVDQNYIVGDKVIYTHPTLGDRVYTCHTNTVSNELPTDKDHWIHGYEISINSPVFDNIYVGYYIKLTNSVNTCTLNRIIHKDPFNKIYVETSPDNTFAASSPTYVMSEFWILKDFVLNGTGFRSIGRSKIGASNIPADTTVTIYYKNKSIDTDKVFVGTVEYLY